MGALCGKTPELPCAVRAALALSYQLDYPDRTLLAIQRLVRSPCPAASVPYTRSALCLGPGLRGEQERIDRSRAEPRVIDSRSGRDHESGEWGS